MKPIKPVDSKIVEEILTDLLKESIEHEKRKDRVCDECGLIHKNGLSWHGHCYECGGELVPFNIEDYERTAVTPKGIEIFNRKTK